MRQSFPEHIENLARVVSELNDEDVFLIVHRRKIPEHVRLHSFMVVKPFHPLG